MRALAPQGSECVLHHRHAPDCDVEDLDMHHPVPVSWSERAGRPIVEAPRPVCPTGHRRVHRAIDTMIRAGGPGEVPGMVRLSFGAKTWELAVEGYSRALEAGLTPTPTL